MDWGDLKKQIVSVGISKPEQQGNRRNRYTDFLVTAVFDNGAESLTRRTYDDFVWLFRRLTDDYLGIIVPVLPERNAVNYKEKFSEEFIQDCLFAANRFLQRIVQHPDLIEASSLLQFLTNNPTEWKESKTAQPSIEKSETFSIDGSMHSDSKDNVLFIDAEAASQAPAASSPKKRTGRMGRWRAGRAERRAINNPKFLMEELPSEAKKFQDIQEYCDQLEVLIKVLAEDSKQLTATYQEQSKYLHSMGTAFTQLWGEHELSNMSASVMYQSVGDCWGWLHKQMEGQHAFGLQFFDTPLEELQLDATALKDVLIRRKKILYDYTIKSKEARVLQEQIDKLKAVADLSSHADRYYRIENLLRAKDTEVAEAKKLSDLMNIRLSTDIERFRVEFHDRMRQVLLNYHKASARYLGGQSRIFLDAVPAIEQMNSGRSNLPKTSAAFKKDAAQLKLSFNTMGASVVPISGTSSAAMATATTTADLQSSPHFVGQVEIPGAPASNPAPALSAMTLVEPTFNEDEGFDLMGLAMGGSVGKLAPSPVSPVPLSIPPVTAQPPTSPFPLKSVPPPAAAPPVLPPSLHIESAVNEAEEAPPPAALPPATSVTPPSLPTEPGVEEADEVVSDYYESDIVEEVSDEEGEFDQPTLDEEPSAPPLPSAGLGQVWL